MNISEQSMDVIRESAFRSRPTLFGLPIYMSNVVPDGHIMIVAPQTEREMHDGELPKVKLVKVNK